MEVRLFILLFLFWAGIHSAAAASSFKNAVRDVVGERAFNGFYRLIYNLFAGFTFLPLLYLATQLPDERLWTIPLPFNILFVLLQLVGVGGVVVSLLQTDVWRFLGVRQVLNFFRQQAEPLPTNTFIATGSYRLVRHPLYFFSLLFLWFTPIMTRNILIFNAAATLYFWLGSIPEERKLAAAFGDAYRDYQKRVPRLIPWKGLNRSS